MLLLTILTFTTSKRTRQGGVGLAARYAAASRRSLACLAGVTAAAGLP